MKQNAAAWERNPGARSSRGDRACTPIHDQEASSQIVRERHPRKTNATQDLAYRLPESSHMRYPISFWLLLCATVACRPEARAQNAQSQPALPACEWCGAADAPTELGHTLRLGAPKEPGERLVVTGRVFEADARTPAADVLLYAYQTDITGEYPRRAGETGNGLRHGALRGWLRTDSDGRYRIATIRPAPYRDRSTAAHIHLTLTPPGDAEGWLDDPVFSDDPLLSARDRDDRGVVMPQRDAQGVWHVVRTLLLSEIRR